MPCRLGGADTPRRRQVRARVEELGSRIKRVTASFHGPGDALSAAAISEKQDFLLQLLVCLHPCGPGCDARECLLHSKWMRNCFSADRSPISRKPFSSVQSSQFPNSFCRSLVTVSVAGLHNPVNLSNSIYSDEVSHSGHGATFRPWLAKMKE